MTALLLPLLPHTIPNNTIYLPTASKKDGKAKVQAAAEDVAKQAKKGGLSEDSVEAIRKHILGIAS